MLEYLFVPLLSLEETLSVKFQGSCACVVTGVRSSGSCLPWAGFPPSLQFPGIAGGAENSTAPGDHLSALTLCCSRSCVLNVRSIVTSGLCQVQNFKFFQCAHCITKGTCPVSKMTSEIEASDRTLSPLGTMLISSVLLPGDSAMSRNRISEASSRISFESLFLAVLPSILSSSWNCSALWNGVGGRRNRKKTLQRQRDRM
ncbi:uncharacterized protein LOC104683524 isoform X3 [Corvus cornix cornix]|uniref:uncharacterized protein LOC104683524 isoform X3 n=1 Tax=Corvus cornix cornix TaxID=932674 RepID=UPI00194F3D07|nr:uncharacterized protein LOC104683524 isoform X3 [Corvus cornix cornix]